MISPLRLVERGQALSKPVRLDPRDRVIRGVEYGLGAPQDIGRNVVFVDLVQFAGKKLLPHVLEQL
jgi:hypothetical protein